MLHEHHYDVKMISPCSKVFKKREKYEHLSDVTLNDEEMDRV